MLDKLISSTAGFVQTNLSLIGNSYPVTFVTGKVRDVIGLPRPEDNDDIAVADPFDDAPSPKPSDYISIYSMVERTIKGERMPIYRWVLFGIGLFVMLITISMVTNHMIMLPVSLRLFATFYLLSIGLFTDFTGLNTIYYILLAYAGICLYRVYLRTTDPTLTIMPFHWDSFLPFRTVKNDFTDFFTPLFYLGLYLPAGASGVRYNNIVLETQEYMEASKGAIPDYKELEGKFNLKPLYDTFENHMITMNLPGFIPETVKPSDTGVMAIAHSVIDMAKRIFGRAIPQTLPGSSILKQAEITMEKATKIVEQGK